MTPESSPEAEIHRRIRVAGPITFAEFMELALYWPHGGYYSYQSGAVGPFGPSGDYYTAPLAHPAFGALLAVQLYQLWQLMDCPNPFYVVELGAGNGLLCRDILTAVAHLPNNFTQSIRYLCLDRRRPGSEVLLSPSGRGVGGEGVPQPAHGEPVEPPISANSCPFVDNSAHRITTDRLPLRNLRGCILSNELLDAFPVHQVRQEQGELREVYIALADPPSSPSGRGAGGAGHLLSETLAEPSTPALAARLEEVGITLAEGQTAEINLDLDAWTASVADSLSAGFVLTIDYGQPAAELYSAELRPRGTLVTYYRHVQTDAPLRNIGRQDITAQVDFTSAVNAGRRAGLAPLGYTTQQRFLRNLGLDHFRRRLASRSASAPPELVAGRQAEANRAGLLALTRPGGLGDFKVLVQGKNVGQPKLWGFEPSPSVGELIETLPVPLLTGRHISLPNAWPV